MNVILVCGGRDYADVRHVRATLDRLHEQEHIDLIVNGGQRGADALSSQWARARRVAAIEVSVVWGGTENGPGLALGPMRNRIMLAAEPTLVVAFPGGKGTASMTRIAKEAGVAVLEER